MKKIFLILALYLSFYIFTINAKELGYPWLADNIVSSRIYAYNKDYKGGKFEGPYTLGAYEGKAEYTYYETPSFKRVYHGKFDFSGACSVEGYFYENKQIGKWYIHIPGKLEAYIDFGQNGNYNGDFQIKTFNGTNVDEFYRGTFRNGSVYYCEYYNSDKTKSGKGYYDSEGLNPIGEWTVNDPYTRFGRFNKLVVSYDREGKLIKSGNRDNETGDWMSDYSSLPIDIAADVRRLIANVCLRETQPPKYTSKGHVYRLY